MPMNPQTIELCVKRAIGQTTEVIEDLMEDTLRNFERSKSDKFKLVLTIAGSRKSGDSFTIKTTGKSSVGLKQDAETDADFIDFGGPNLFQVAEQHGAKVSIEVKDAPAGK